MIVCLGEDGSKNDRLLIFISYSFYLTKNGADPSNYSHVQPLFPPSAISKVDTSFVSEFFE